MGSQSFVSLLVSTVILLVLTSAGLLAAPSDLVTALRSNEFWYAVTLSTVTASVSTLAALATSLMLAVPLLYGEERVKVFDAIVSLPVAMPPVALGVALLAFFTRNPLGSLIDRAIGVVFSIPGLIVAQYFVILPIVARGVRAAFETLPREYIEVARTLGYGRTEVLVKVALPLAKRGITASTVLGFTRAFGEFGASVMVAGATRFKTETVPIAIYLAMESGSIGLAAAMTLLSLLVAVLAVIALEVVGWRRW